MKEKILIIEDDGPFRKTLTRLLETEGYSVTGAGNGQQAIDAAKKTFFELIIADVRLPGGMDGIETVESIKKIRHKTRSMVIIITGYADKNAPVRAIRIGVDDYIYKPFKIEEFLFSVERNLEVFWVEKERQKYIEMLVKMNKKLKAAEKQLQDYSVRAEKKLRKRTSN